MTPETTSPFTGMIKEGIVRFLTGKGAAGADAEPDNWIRGLKTKAQNITTGAVGKGFHEALDTPEVREAGAKYVEDTLKDAIDGPDGIKANFAGTLDSIDGNLKDDADGRNTYEKMKDLLKVSGDDKWYMRLGKKVVARVAAFTMPILGYISGVVASRMVDMQDKSTDFGKKLTSIYDGLLGKLAPNQPHLKL